MYGSMESVAGTSTYLAIKLEPIQTGQWCEPEVILSGDTAMPQEGRWACGWLRLFASEGAAASR